MALAVGALLPLAPTSAAAIPATPLMTVYRYDGALDVPYYAVDDFARRGTRAKPAGSLAQGTSVLPCLVIRSGRPLTDANGTPYVGFEVVVDSRKAHPASTDRFRAVFAGRKSRQVRNHHCPPGVRYVVGVRDLYEMSKPPFFDPPPRSAKPQRPGSELDAIVRAFHDSRHCRTVNQKLVGRRAALAAAWTAFEKDHPGRWPTASLARARRLDYTMRTALYEGHLDRGCSAYAACERDVIALSIRNRARGSCSRAQGCRYDGDFEGVASKISQYNIWDEYLTQVSGLTSCFLRSDLAGHERYARIRAMYEQNRSDVERILFGSDSDLAAIFDGTTPAQGRSLRHYYHPPAMGKCFPQHERLEYMSGAVARKGSDFALIASTRIEVGRKRGSGYEFRSVTIDERPDRDVIRTRDDYAGFLVDGRQVSLRKSRGCRPYGTPSGCKWRSIGRYRRTPAWLSAGRPIEFMCRIRSRGKACGPEARLESATVGGVCDTAMQPIADVR